MTEVCFDVQTGASLLPVSHRSDRVALRKRLKSFYHLMQRMFTSVRRVRIRTSNRWAASCAGDATSSETPHAGSDCIGVRRGTGKNTGRPELGWKPRQVRHLAKTPVSATNPASRLMLRSLLTERFKLVIRNEDKSMSAWVMTADNSGKPGAQLKQSAGAGPTNCNAQPAEPPNTVLLCKNMTMAVLAQVLKQIDPLTFDTRR